MVQYAASAPLEIGTKAPDFSLPGVDGKEHTLSEYAGSVLVVLFSCNHCPYVKAYEQRMIDFTQEYSGKGVSVVAINANRDDNYPDDSFENMQARFEELGFPFDYLRDESQDVARAYGGVCTPHAFVFSKDQTLVYQGALDDNWEDPASVQKEFLKEAVDAALKDSKPETATTQPVGCSIKWR